MDIIKIAIHCRCADWDGGCHADEWSSLPGGQLAVRLLRVWYVTNNTVLYKTM